MLQRGIGMAVLWLGASFMFMNYGLITSLECRVKHNLDETVSKNDCYRTCEYPPKPRICEYEFTAEWTHTMSAYCMDCPFNKEDCSREKCVAIDGSSRQAAIVNGTMPGPYIQVCQGDTIRVKVNNNLHVHGLSIHWHGLFQTGTNWMDGVPNLTQCPIAHGSSFVYEVLAEPAGSHWWHSHVVYSRGDGIYGPLIVRKPRETELISNQYDFDLPEHIMNVADWSDIAGLETDIAANSIALRKRDPTISILVNGKAEGADFVDETGQTFNTPRATFEVEEGLRYRMRVIGSHVATCTTAFYIESHPMTIIATDGFEVLPIEVDSFIIAPGERYDFVLHANAVPSTYCMYFVGVAYSSCGSNSSVILKYKNSSIDDPQCVPTVTFDDVGQSDSMRMISLNDLDSLEPAHPDLHYVDEIYYVTTGSFVGTLVGYYKSYMTAHIAMDNVSHISPDIPFTTNKPLETDICHPNADRSLSEYCSTHPCLCTNVLKVKLGQVVEIVILNIFEDEIRHAMHIHGQSFRVIGWGIFNESMTLHDVIASDKAGGLIRKSPDDAILKDTVDVVQNGYAILRWKADNPGYWFFHCHTQNHEKMGMIIQVGDHEEMPNPPDDFPRCEHWSNVKWQSP